MKIAVIGTRGIPNRYGGFEQFAEIVTEMWVKAGHEVICYSPHWHFYNESHFNGVEIIKKYSPEDKLGASANYIYDFLCLRDAVKRDCDIYLELGYNSSAFGYWFVSNKVKSRIVSNMDGLEWKRDKWGRLTQGLILAAEKVAVKQSAALVSDNIGIQEYFKEVYNASSEFIAYGCDLVNEPSKKILSDLDYLTGDFDLIIARLEPENSIAIKLEGFMRSTVQRQLIVVGNADTEYGLYLKTAYNDSRIKFVGGIYDKQILDALRFYSTVYYHGHTVGGTNPSLLEAMAARSMVFAHDNSFNRSVLLDNAYFFLNAESLTELINNFEPVDKLTNEKIELNLLRVSDEYNWEKISQQYLDLFERVNESNQ